MSLWCVSCKSASLMPRVKSVGHVFFVFFSQNESSKRKKKQKQKKNISMSQTISIIREIKHKFSVRTAHNMKLINLIKCGHGNLNIYIYIKIHEQVVLAGYTLYIFFNQKTGSKLKA